MPARPEHLADIQDIERAAAARFPPDILPPALADGVIPVPKLRKASKRGELWIAATVPEGLPVGFAMMGDAGGHAMLLEVDVVPEHGRRGLGKRLVERTVAAAEERGRAELYLTTFRSVPWNAPFYARIGFAVVAEALLPDAVLAVLAAERAAGLADRVCMRRTLRQERGGGRIP